MDDQRRYCEAGKPMWDWDSTTQTCLQAVLGDAKRDSRGRQLCNINADCPVGGKCVTPHLGATEGQRVCQFRATEKQREVCMGMGRVISNVAGHTHECWQHCDHSDQQRNRFGDCV